TLRSARDYRVRLRAGPLERLLDLGAGGVRQLGRLVPRLLEETRAARLGLLQLPRCVLVRGRDELARLRTGCAQDLGALILALLAEPPHLLLARLHVALAAPDLLLRPAELCGRRGLGVALELVGELRGGPDRVQGVHP